MADSRIERYARLLVEYCVDVQPGWQVVVSGTPAARPLVDEIAAAIGARGAYALLRIGFTDFFGAEGGVPWILAAPEPLLAERPPVERYLAENADALIGIVAPENTREAAAVDTRRLALLRVSERPWLERIASSDLEDFLYGACLLDWHEERERRSTARSTSLSVTVSRRSAGRTRVRSTATSSRTCGGQIHADGQLVQRDGRWTV